MSRPRLRYFLVCDAAQVNQGKVTAIGLFDTIVSAMYPAIHASLAVVLGFEGGEARTYDIQLMVVGPGGQAVMEAKGPSVTMSGQPGTVSQVLQLQGLTFPEPGTYLVQVFCDGDYLAQQSLHLAEPPRPSVKNRADLEALLKTPDIINSANSELECPKCRTMFRFQVNLDPDAAREPGFLAPPPGKVFACGTCGTMIPCPGLAQNLRRLLGLHRSWLPQLAQQPPPHGHPGTETNRGTTPPQES